VMRRFWSHMARRAKNEEGFTLIELLVVLAILAAIAAIAVPRVLQTTSDANGTRDQANQAIIQSAVERFYIENGSWPIATGTTNGIDFVALEDYLSQPPADQGQWSLNLTNHRVQHLPPTP